MLALGRMLVNARTPLNTGTNGVNSATIIRHAASPRSQPTWSAGNPSAAS